MCTMTVISSQDDCVTLGLAGPVNADSLHKIDRCIDEGKQSHGQVELDLSEVTLLDRAAARYFGESIQRGVRVVNCPLYIKPWISPRTTHDDEPTITRG